jgi:hypothetical protein
MTVRSSGRKNLSSRLALSRPFLVLILLYALGMVFFTAFRLVFYLSSSELASDAGMWTTFKAFAVGARFDQIVVLFMLSPLLLVLPWINLRLPFMRIAATIYATVFFACSVFLMLADMRFYAYFDSHLNYLAYEYIGEGSMFWDLIATDQRFVPFMAIWLVVSVVFFFFIRKTLSWTRTVAHRYSWKAQIIYFTAFLVLAIVGMRGRLGIAPMDWGMAVVGQNHFVNQLALNGIYTLGKSLAEEGHDPRLSYRGESERFPFVPFDKGLDFVQSMLYQPGDEWLDPDSSLLRKTTQPDNSLSFRPNIVFVIMESWAARNTGVLGSPRDLTPHFDSLAGHGILFSNFYASGTRTNYGLGASLCAFPSLPGRAILKRYNARHPFVTISEILHERGYRNYLAYGGDLVFDNVEGFFRRKNYDAFFGEGYFGAENGFSKWGIPDHILFDRVTKLIDSLPRPMQLTVLTLSNHEPYDLPDSSVQRYLDNTDSSRHFNAQLYADFAVGEFIEKMSHNPIFDSTIFVFTSDHTRFRVGRFYLDPEVFRVPLLIYAPGILGADGIVIDQYGCQTDIIPTLMGLLGGDYTHQSWGRDLLKLDDDDRGFAVMNVLDRIGYVDPDFFYFERLGQIPSLVATGSLEFGGWDLKDIRPEECQRIQQRLHTYLQIAEQLCTPSIR